MTPSLITAIIGTEDGICLVDGKSLLELGLPGERVSAVIVLRDGSVAFAG